MGVWVKCSPTGIWVALVTTSKMLGKMQGNTCILLTCNLVDDAVAPSREENECCVDCVFEISDPLPAKLGSNVGLLMSGYRVKSIL